MYRFQSLVSSFIETFDNDVKALRKAESKADVLEVRQVVLDLPRFATMLDKEQSIFKKHWDLIWNSFFESVRKKLRLVGGSSGGGQEQDISDSIAFLQAARKLLQQQKTHIESLLASPAPAPSETAAGRAPPARSEAGSRTPTSTASADGDAGSARSSGGAGWGSKMLSLVFGNPEKEDFADAGEDFEDAFEGFEDDAQEEGAAGQAESLAGPAGARAPPSELPLCVFPLPVDDEQLQALIEKLDAILGQIEIDTEKIDENWRQLVENVDFATGMTSVEETLQFIRYLKLQSQAITASGEYGFLKQAPTADRAITRISTTASDCIKAFDASKPEEAISVLHNLTQLCTLCPRIIDDDVELQSALTGPITKRCDEANAWVNRIQKELAEKGAEFYAKAEKERRPVERKKLLHQVTNSLELHIRLHEKLVDCQLRENNGAEAPVVAEIKNRIEGMQADIRQRLRRGAGVTADNIAEAVHTIYVTAFDLGQTSIVKHAEKCIGDILQDCKGRPGLGLQEVGAVLENDLPQGGEIVANIALFAELNLVQFQQMTMGKTVEGTVEEVAKLNKLSERHAESLLHVVKEVMSAYDKTMRTAKFHCDFPMMVRNLRRVFSADKSVPGLIGGVFAIWSLSSTSEQCPTPRVPLAAQVVAIVRLLGIDKPGSRGFLARLGSAVGLSSRTEPSIDASHLAQIKTGQGKSVVLGTLATVLCIVGFQ
jgi:hypothetical protein